MTGSDVWPGRWHLLGYTQGNGMVWSTPIVAGGVNPHPPNPPEIRMLHHPSIASAHCFGAYGPESYAGALINNETFFFTYDRGFARLGFGDTRVTAQADALKRGDHEWWVGEEPCDRTWPTVTMRDRVFNGMLAALHPAPIEAPTRATPHPRTSYHPPQINEPSPETPISTPPPPPGWTLEQIVNVGSRNAPVVLTGWEPNWSRSLRVTEPLDDTRTFRTYSYTPQEWNRLLVWAQAQLASERIRSGFNVWTRRAS